VTYDPVAIAPAFGVSRSQFRRDIAAGAVRVGIAGKWHRLSLDDTLEADGPAYLQVAYGRRRTVVRLA